MKLPKAREYSRRGKHNAERDTQVGRGEDKQRIRERAAKATNAWNNLRKSKG